MVTRKTAKAKGKRLESRVEDDLKDFTGLCEDHIRSAIGSENGEDIILSKEARKVFPYAVECKSRKSMSVYRYFFQAQKNAKGSTPLVILKENHKEPLAVVTWKHFRELLSKLKELE